MLLWKYFRTESRNIHLKLTSQTLGFGLGGGNVLSFTPTCSSVTLEIAVGSLPPGVSRTINLDSVTVPRYDSSVIENVTSLVCNEDHYHYGFNGKYKDNEWAGVGNHFDYGMRHFDPRVGRPISFDPLFKKFPMLTPYQFFSNNPIRNIDLDGLEGIPAETSVDGTVNKGAVDNTYVQLVNAKKITPQAKQEYHDSGPGGDQDLVNSHGSDGADKNRNPLPGKGTKETDVYDLFKIKGLDAESPKNALDATNFVLTGLDILGGEKIDNAKLPSSSKPQTKPPLTSGGDRKNKADTFKYGNNGEAMIRDENGDRFVPLKSLPNKDYENNCKNCQSQ